MKQEDGIDVECVHAVWSSLYVVVKELIADEMH